MTPELLSVPAVDGRTLEVLVSGAEDGFPLLFHGGLPSAVVPFPLLDRAADALGLRVVTFSRPGYGGSTPRADGTTTYCVVDDVADVEAVLGHLGITEFVTLGWSGGGPRALACAALMAGRCRAAATLAGLGPYGADGLHFLDGMGPENVRDINASLEGVDALEAVLAPEVAGMAAVSADQVAASLGGLASRVDVAALTEELAEMMASGFRRSMLQGMVGIRDDSLAVVRPWGFDLASIAVPVSVWQGRQDKMVPFAHGVYLADRVPGARAHLFDDEGHLSLTHRIDRILADLTELAGLPRS